MACDGIYIGECCQPAVCQGHIVELLARNRFYPPFTFVSQNCIVPQVGYRRLKTTTTWRMTWATSGPCGTGTFTTTRVEESTVTACGVFNSIPPVFTGETRTECASGAGDSLPNFEEISNVVGDVIQTRVTRRYDGNGNQLRITVVLELLDPFSIGDWLDVLDGGFSYWIANGQGKRTQLEWNCATNLFTVAQSNQSVAFTTGSAFHTFLGFQGETGSFGIEIRRSFRVIRAIKPYRITTYPDSGNCFTTRIVDVLKEFGPEVQEVDCIGINPSLTENISITQLT